MELTEHERSLLNGDCGSEAKELMEVMLKIAELNGARELIEIKQVMLATTEILSLAGEVGIEYMVKLANAGAKFRVPTYTDVVSIDVEEWQRLGIPKGYTQTQRKSVEAVTKMGGILSLTCAPYLCGAIPKLGDHVAYVETSAVIFVNSYFGARTNREVDVSAIASGLCGRAPYYGYHLDENRKGEVLVDLQTELKDGSDYDALGNYVGKIVKTRIPVFKNMNKDASVQSLMHLGAAMATTGTVALFHAFDITPEIRRDPDKYGKEKISEEVRIGGGEMKAAYEELNTTSQTGIEFVAIGCPHFDIERIKYIAEYLDGRQVHKDVELWICSSDTVKRLATRTGDIERIERTGAKVIVDTCMVVAPIKMLGYTKMATDSAKAQFYVSGFGLGVRFGTTEQCLEAAIKGYWEG